MARAVKQFTVVLEPEEVELLKASVRAQIENIAYNCVRKHLNLPDTECSNERIHIGNVYEVDPDGFEIDGIAVEVEVDI